MRHAENQHPAHTLSSVSNALGVLTLAHQEGKVTLASISEYLDVGKSTAHRLVSTLAGSRFLQRSPVQPNEYIVGPVLLDIGSSALRRADIRRFARRPMERLSDQLGETVNLVVLEGNATRVVDGVESKQPIRVGLRTGVVLPANSTAAGKVLLAELPDKVLHDLFPRGLPSATGQTTATWPELKRQLAKIRADGYAFNSAESDPALHGLAAPVRDQSGEIAAALAIAAPYYRLPIQTVPAKMRFLREAAAAITRAHG